MALLQTPEQVADACGDDPTWICRQVLESTDSEGWARASDVLVAKPAHILLIVVVAWVANRLLHRAIRRFTERVANPEAQERIQRLRRHTPDALQSHGPESLRSAARATTLSHLLRSATTVVVWTIAGVMILGELGVALGPLIAGAGIAGVALGFGAQSLVKDFISGTFMLIEDQYGVGDIIDAGEASGTVEAVSLRTTRLRDVNGTVWHIPNGNILRIGNMSQQWARALLDVSLATDTDVDHAQDVIKRVADSVWNDPDWHGEILEEPEVWGVERLGPDAIVIRLVVKTKPAEQFTVMRELRRRLLEAFAAEGVELPDPGRVVWVQREAGTSQESEPTPE
ncbi:MAG TPA: mechanosensitive ion channel family protein [Jiangellaceae bacterium]|nr:mechanosensitive ion channel family protein [Jiangellaceae bacterium]